MIPSSRDQILTSIRSALNDVADTSIPAPYASQPTLPPEARRHLFVDRLLDYGAEVLPVTPATLLPTIEDTLAAKAIHRLVAPAGFPAHWLPTLAFLDHNLSIATIEAADAVLTASTCAIAVSGSIVLQHGPTEGRRVLSLLPDRHICVVRLATLYETLPEALATLDPTRPTTFISGPSATADIEMTRIQGVHGPRQLTILLLDEESAPILE